MSDYTNLSRAQTRFLRALRQPHGTPVRWPSPHLMRRWMQQQPFHELLKEILAAINFQADLHLARATCQATADLPATFSATPDRDRQALLATIRLSHYHRNDVRRYYREPKPFPWVDPEAFARLQAAKRQSSSSLP